MRTAKTSAPQLLYRLHFSRGAGLPLLTIFQDLSKMFEMLAKVGVKGDPGSFLILIDSSLQSHPHFLLSSYNSQRLQLI